MANLYKLSVIPYSLERAVHDGQDPASTLNEKTLHPCCTSNTMRAVVIVVSTVNIIPQESSPAPSRHLKPSQNQNWGVREPRL